MRRFASLAVAATLLAGPATAFAEFTSPSDLLMAVEAETKPQTFSVTAKGHVDQTWFAIWANGAAEGLKSDMMTGKMKMSMTVDVVYNDFKMRAKGQVLMKDGMVYAKLDSITGAYSDLFMTFNAAFGQKLWLQIPMDPSMLEMHAGMTGMGTPEEANEMFSMTHTKFGAGHKYVLTMRPEYSQQFSDLMRDALGAQAVGQSDDFFPFRDLAYDNADFTVKVDTNAQDQFQYSSFDMHWKAGNAELTMTGNSQRQATTVYVETPKNVWTMEELEKHYNELMGIPSYEEEMMEWETEEGTEWEMPVEEDMMEGSDFDTVDSDEWWEPATDGSTQYYSDECWNPELDPLKKLMMQRSGECPVEDTNNRTFRR